MVIEKKPKRVTELAILMKYLLPSFLVKVLICHCTSKPQGRRHKFYNKQTF